MRTMPGKVSTAYAGLGRVRGVGHVVVNRPVSIIFTAGVGVDTAGRLSVFGTALIMFYFFKS